MQAVRAHLYVWKIAGICLVALAWLLPVVLDQTGLIAIPPLMGKFVPVPRPTWSDSALLSGSYAEQAEKYYNENSGLRPWLVRVKNQLRYSLLRQVFAENVVVGKENYVFGLGYLYARTGQNFIGTDSLEMNSRELKILQDSLEQHGKKLLVVIAPGKGFYYPEYAPDSLSKETGKSNYHYFTHCLQKDGVHFLDFNQLFMQWKAKAAYPLYTKLGTHWSNYGVHISVDTLLKKMSALLQKPMGSPGTYSMELKERAREFDDADLFETMNLLFRFDDTFHWYAYPTFRFTTPASYKPNVLAICDSYYLNLLLTRVPQFCFDPCSNYWYYANTSHCNDLSEKTEVDKLDLARELEKRDIVMLLCTETNLPRFPFGFVKKAIKIYNPNIN